MATRCPVSCYSLRPDADGRVEALELLRDHGVDALVTTVLAMGAAGGTSDDAGDDWQVPQLADLGVPVIQAPACNRSRDDWAGDEAGLTPLDVAMGVAIPEFDGRIIGPAFAFKEEVDDGGELGTPVIASRTDPERAARVAGLAVRHARLRRVPPADKRVAVVMSAYPTKRSRLGNAVGLDTPASVIALLHALRDAGLPRRPHPRRRRRASWPSWPTGFTYESPTLTPQQDDEGRGPPRRRDLRGVVRGAGPPAPGRGHVHLGRRARRGLRRRRADHRLPRASTSAACW